jgi:hypothetical protein
MGRKSRRCGVGLHGGELGEEPVRLTKSARTSHPQSTLFSHRHKQHEG